MRNPRPRLGDATMSLRGLMTTLMVLKQEDKIKIKGYKDLTQNTMMR